MIRPTVMIAEPEPGAALSTRKLVVETGKYNVLTTHTAAEATATIERFPECDAAVVLADLPGGPVPEVISHLKQVKPEMPVIALSPNNAARFPGAEHHLPSHDPVALLILLRNLLGDPRQNSN